LVRFKEETGMPGRGWGGVLRYGLPGLVLGLALAAGGRGGGRVLLAQAQYPMSAPGASAGVPPQPMPGQGGGGYERPRAVAPSQAHGGGGASDGTIAFTVGAGGPVQLLYLIDTKARAFTIYRVDTVKGTVKLDAARQYGWDLKLTSYNNLDPQVAAIEDAVKALGQQSQSQSQPQSSTTR
jgi:hypothetical protein